MTGWSPKDSRPPVVKVTLFENGCFHSTLCFAKGKLLIGRNPEADIDLCSVKVSRRHALLRVKDNGLHIEDLGSSNGTRVNGQAIRLYDLLPEDRVSIGHYELNFHLLAEEKPKKDLIETAESTWDAEWEDTLEVQSLSWNRSESTKETDAPMRRRKHYPPKAG